VDFLLVQLLRITAAALVLVGSCVTLRVLLGYLPRAYRSTRWSSVEGKVSVCRLSTEKPLKGGLRSLSLFDHESPGIFLEYEYKVGGRCLDGSRIFFGDEVVKWASARLVRGRYQEGDRVQVYYCGDSPTLCVLEPGVRVELCAILFLGLAVIAFGTSCWLPADAFAWW